MIIVYKDKTVPFESVVLRLEPDRYGDYFNINAYIGDKRFSVKEMIYEEYAGMLYLKDIVEAYKRGDRVYEVE